MGDPTIADAILDRLIHNAHKIDLSMKGESMRKKYAVLT
ncbi:ATP-binding protein [Syntrophus gentianae]